MSKHMQNRPLSPHLTIYRPQLNSILSILHRITGIALSITLLILIGFFISMQGVNTKRNLPNKVGVSSYNRSLHNHYIQDYRDYHLIFFLFYTYHYNNYTLPNYLGSLLLFRLFLAYYLHFIHKKRGKPTRIHL